MDTAQIEIYANKKLREHGLYDRGWRFKFDNAIRRFGSCRYRTKYITISKALVKLNNAAECEDTILHEIGHALAGSKAGHGPIWKGITKRIGGSGNVRYKTADVISVSPSWISECPVCHTKVAKHKKQDLSCGRCSKTYDTRYLLIWHKL